MAALLCVWLIAAAVWVGDWAARTSSVHALVGEIERSEAAMVAALSAVGAVVRGQESADGLSPGARQELQAAAASARGQVADAGAAIEGQPVQPWHADVLQARASYLAHNAAWQAYLERAAGDAAVWFVSDPEIERTWVDVTPLLTEMVPTPAWPSLSQRVTMIIDSGDEPDSGPTLQAAGVSQRA